MSVINKMLKDLEGEQDIEVTPKGNIMLSKKNHYFTISVALTIIIIILLFYFFNTKVDQKTSDRTDPPEVPSDQENLKIAKSMSALSDANKTPRLIVPAVDEGKIDSTIKTIPEPEALVNHPEKPIQKIAIEIKKVEKSVELNKPAFVEKIIEEKSADSEKTFKITKSKIAPKQQAQRYWNDAEKHPRNAEKFLNQALGLDSTLHGARLQLIALLVTQKRLSDAEREIDKGLILLPQDPAYIEWKARLRVAFNDAKTGLQWLLKITPDIEKHINYYGILATLASQLKYNDIAAETYLKLSKIQPEHGPWLLGMAISEERLGKNQMAKEYYQKAQSADGLTPRARIFIQQKLNKLES